MDRNLCRIVISVICIFICTLSCISKRAFDRSKMDTKSMEQRKQLYLNNISATKVLVEHIGATDKPIYPVLFTCADHKDEKEVELSLIGAAKCTKTGYEITLDTKTLAEVIDIILTEVHNTIDERNVLPSYGTFLFRISSIDSEVTVLTFGRDTSSKILRKISILLPQQSEKRYVLENILRRIE